MPAILLSACAIKHRWTSAGLRLLMLCAAAAAVNHPLKPAEAFDELTSSQQLVYDTPHLSNTVSGQQINYRYHSQSGDSDAVADRVLLSVNKAYAGGRRDVALDFLSAERHMNLPEFPGYRGNPIIIAMLEHIAQGLGQETGGGVLYFRNRIRDALAKPDNRIEQISVRVGERSVDATRLHLLPFSDDKYLLEQPAFTGAAISILLSDRVPGGVIAVGVKSSHDKLTRFEKEIVIE